MTDPAISASPKQVDTELPVDIGRIRTARLAGLLYLGLAITGGVGFLVIRNQLLVAGDPQGTLANLLAHESLARLGIVLEMSVVVTQALTAVWFYRLFRDVDSFAAGLIAAFGLINAVAILGSAAMLATALEVAAGDVLARTGDTAGMVQLLYVVSSHLWGVGAMFFGLWLIPMGWLVLHSRWLPRPLGWILIVGGVGYLLSAFVDYLFPAAGGAVDLMTVPATIGEVWIVGYLIVIGVRRESVAP
ncbi:MAG: DUF4386 domain-containing protein [Nocardioides sp.]